MQIRFGQPLPDYAHFIKMIQEIGYEGQLTYELCHPVIDKKHEYVNLDFVHQQFNMARKFMRTIIDI